MGSEEWGWALELSARLEKIWPCWIPFLAGLSLFGVLRMWFSRESRIQRMDLRQELERDFDLWLKKNSVNKRGGAKSNGA
jgi:hypothetical protein